MTAPKRKLRIVQAEVRIAAVWDDGNTLTPQPLEPLVVSAAQVPHLGQEITEALAQIEAQQAEPEAGGAE